MSAQDRLNAAIERYLSANPNPNNVIVAGKRKASPRASKGRVTARPKGHTKFGRFTPGKGLLS